MRVVVLVFFLREEQALVLENFDDQRIGLEDVDAGEFRDTGGGGEAAAIIHRCENFEAVFLAELIVVLTMTGGDMDKAGARFSGDEVGGKNFPFAVVAEEGMRVGEADEIGAFDGQDSL